MAAAAMLMDITAFQRHSSKLHAGDLSGTRRNHVLGAGVGPQRMALINDWYAETHRRS